MPPRPPFPNLPEPLPRSPGPKLAAFTPTAIANIDFIEELGDPQEDQHGRVWKVQINGMQPFYALKMFSMIQFRFCSSEYLKELSQLDHCLASPQLYVDYYDPFNCECRAFGRLKQEDRNGDLAVEAHGYLLLTQEQEAAITEKAGGFKYPPANAHDKLDGANSWGRHEEHRHLPVRAIVKELVTDPCHFTPSQVPGMWKGLEDLHKLGILVRDIGVGNYMGGKLIDFSMAWTTPHPSFKYMKPVALEEERREDPHYLGKAIDELRWREKWDEVDIPEQLLKCALGEGETGKYGVDPAGYNWKKWERYPQTADALLARKWVAEKQRR